MNFNVNPSHISSSSSSSEDEFDLTPHIQAHIKALEAQQSALLNLYANHNLLMAECLTQLSANQDVEVSGPPEFLNHAVEEQTSVSDLDHQKGRRGGRSDLRDKKDTPSGAVVEAKPQVVGIHERVRSNIRGSKPPTLAVPSTTQDGAKRVASATNPSAEDSAELLRMCLQCRVPKTYSSARGMVCPVCGDRPLADTDKDTKKKGSTVKDKEKSKRMKGQSSYATWKSETEM